MNEEQLKKAKEVHGDVVHVPLVMGGSPSYTLDAAKEPLSSPGPFWPTFIWQHQKWNDPAVQKLNPQCGLPDQEIVVVAPGRRQRHHLSGSIISARSARVEKEVGVAPPSTGRPARAKRQRRRRWHGQRDRGDIGYIELIYALQNKSSTAPCKTRTAPLSAPASNRSPPPPTTR